MLFIRTKFRVSKSQVGDGITITHVHIPSPARVSLLVALIVCLDSIFIMENPERSAVVGHPRLVWVFKGLKAVGTEVLCLAISWHLIPPWKDFWDVLGWYLT